MPKKPEGSQSILMVDQIEHNSYAPQALQSPKMGLDSRGRIVTDQSLNDEYTFEVEPIPGKASPKDANHRHLKRI